MNDIWIPRCDRVQDYERSMGITRDMKLNKRKEISDGVSNFSSFSSPSFYHTINI